MTSLSRGLDTQQKMMEADMNRLSGRLSALEGRDQKAKMLVVGGVRMNLAQAIHHFRKLHGAASDARRAEARGEMA